MSTYSWDCYRETIFEQEIEKLNGLPVDQQDQQVLDVVDYLQKRLKEVKEHLNE